MYKLTIAIPAFKRPELLEQALQAALEASDGFDVEILICDDSGEELNKEVSLAHSDDRGNIRYISNETCLGIDANIKKCFDSANGEFCWVIGEDDHVTRGSLSYLFDRIENSPTAVVFLNYVYCSNDYKSDLSAPLLKFKGHVSRQSILENFYKFGFIGSIVVSVAQWRSHSPKAPLGTYFHHLSVIGTIVFSKGDLDIHFIDFVCVRNRAENGDSASWTSQALAVHFGYYDAITFFEPLLSEDERSLLYEASEKLFRPKSALWLLSKRADKAFSVLELQSFRHQYSSLQRKCFWLIAIVPVPIAKIAKSLHRAINRKNRHAE